MPTTKCRECGKPVHTLEVFPKGRCLACHEKATYRGFTVADVREALERVK